ncbi:hypothetical protein [Massilia sp. ST3]|uniref:hypothetical protein n=1 Tax=Massilia sp. ST3 TaxID=2824903 RepID=UPI001B83DB25|nr:hypothetical protein [Massilia sp. ST3]MBQ5946811.1 hypothetical protein [Massilia sp. ST3]
MSVICPKCSHVRPPDATNPDWQCPACGICYAKSGSLPSAPAAALRSARMTETAASQPWDCGPLLKILLVVVLGWGLHVLLQRREEAPLPEDDVAAVAEPQESAAGVAAADAVIAMSEVDATVLYKLAARLEEGCARNKFGLTDSACRALVRARSDACASATAQRFPGQLGDTRRMALVVDAHVGCIFDGYR